MDKTFDEFTMRLQKEIFEEAKETYGEEAFKRWLNPIYMGIISNPDGYACLKGVCGDTMEIFLKFENEKVKEASYQTDGCGSSNICGSFAAEMALGKNPDELLNITGGAIIKRLGGLPDAEEHCAFLAAETLQEALNSYMINRANKGNKK